MMRNNLGNKKQHILCLLLLGWLQLSNVYAGFSSEELYAPFPARDYAFPGYLMLRFAPAAATTLGLNGNKVEYSSSVINNFQLSSPVRRYLEQKNDGFRKKLSREDIAYILQLPNEQSFYIDAEIKVDELTMQHGLTDNLDIGVTLSYLSYGGNKLDHTIFNFHDLLDLGQHARDYVEDNHFQVVLGIHHFEQLVISEAPIAGGIADPTVFTRYAVPESWHGWRFNLAAAVKAPAAQKNKFLSTGNWDAGLQIVADKRYPQNAFITNVNIVKSKFFRKNYLKHPARHSINLNWLHRFQGNKVHSFVQFSLSEHPFNYLVSSDMSETMYQLSMGLKWNSPLGVFGLGFTENLFKHDNTPDLAFHAAWTIHSGQFTQGESGAHGWNPGARYAQLK